MIVIIIDHHNDDNGDDQVDDEHNRHSVHWDSAAHASSGLETLDFPPRKDMMMIWVF